MTKLHIEKLDLDEFLQKLISLYEEGMDFVDIEVTVDDFNETEIKIITKDEYRSNIQFEEDIDEEDFDNLI